MLIGEGLTNSNPGKTEWPEGMGRCGQSNSGKGGGDEAKPAVIIIICAAAAVFLVAALFVWNRRAVASKQPHRESSMPTVGGEGDV